LMITSSTFSRGPSSSLESALSLSTGSLSLMCA
jgi:hypothetical protein